MKKIYFLFIFLWLLRVYTPDIQTENGYSSTNNWTCKEYTLKRSDFYFPQGGGNMIRFFKDGKMVCISGMWTLEEI